MCVCVHVGAGRGGGGGRCDQRKRETEEYALQSFLLQITSDQVFQGMFKGFFFSKKNCFCSIL